MRIKKIPQIIIAAVCPKCHKDIADTGKSAKLFGEDAGEYNILICIKCKTEYLLKIKKEHNHEWQFTGFSNHKDTGLWDYSHDHADFVCHCGQVKAIKIKH